MRLRSVSTAIAVLTCAVVLIQWHLDRVAEAYKQGLAARYTETTTLGALACETVVDLRRMDDHLEALARQLKEE